MKGRNNESCRRSREKAKIEEEKRRQRMEFLVKDNSDKRNNINSLKREEEFYNQAISAFSSPVLSEMFERNGK